ncbi:GNAT family N-acetyltransferase [Lentilitoribacter sp. EG35]|uniref:GNAT family N-acetyltransferase n=1 Tax=Lentilitoribacter sp. EG35 TaxID=3234192 RepID=UPI0034616A30
MQTYQFRNVERNDFPMLGEWLRSPELLKWWGDPEEEHRLIRHDINDPKINLMIVSLNEMPFAYVQDYCVHDWPQDYFASFPPTTRAIDTFIGIDEMIGKGHGHGYLGQHIENLISHGAEQIVIDPYVANERAIKAYEKSGFKKHSEHETHEGRICLMTYV